MKRMRAVNAVLAGLLVLCGCTQRDQEEARRKADEAAEKTRREAQKLGRETKRAASDLSEKTRGALDKSGATLNSSGESAEEKLRSGAGQAGRELSAATLTAKVKTRLAGTLGLNAVTDIQVESRGGVVTLRGYVDTLDAKRRAKEEALRVEDVTKVVDELKVRAQ